jgi:hypothetical protein
MARSPAVILRPRVSGWTAAVLVAAIGASGSPGVPAAGLDHVERQFAAIEPAGEAVDLPASPDFDAYAPEAGGTHHFQGIQRLRGGGWVITGSAAADVFIIDASGRAIREHADRWFLHAGGIQLLDDDLAVGVETGGRSDGQSRVVFYDLSQPMSPRRLVNTIARRPEELPQPCPERRAPTAGAVALAALPDGGLLMIVGRWDSDVLDLYRSRSRRLPEAQFQHLTSWCTAAVVDEQGQSVRFGRYQALSLLVQRDGRPFLLGFETRDGHDLAALFRLNLRLDAPGPQVGLTKLGEREFLCRGGCGFAAGAGASIEDGRLVFYSVEHRTRGRSLRLYRFRPASSIE